MIRQTYNKKRKAALFQTHCAAVRKQGTSTCSAPKADRPGRREKSGSGVEGIGLGLLGIGLPDIPLFTAMILKVFMKSPFLRGTGYSHPQEERRFLLLQLIRTALSHGEALAAPGAGPLHRFGPLGRRHHTAPPDRCDGRSLSANCCI